MQPIPVKWAEMHRNQESEPVHTTRRGMAVAFVPGKDDVPLAIVQHSCGFVAVRIDKLTERTSP